MVLTYIVDKSTGLFQSCTCVLAPAVGSGGLCTKQLLKKNNSIVWYVNRGVSVMGNGGALRRLRRYGVTIGALLSLVLPTVAQMTNQETEEANYYRNKGMQPLVAYQQDGDYAPDTFLIPHDITVQKGKVLTFYPGCTILFTKNAMLVVQGTLICLGSVDAPVIFKKLDNKDYVNSIDPRIETRWDGIYLSDSSKLEMAHTNISDSKYGIVVSGSDVHMALDSVTFRDNKFQNVRIGNRMLKVAEKRPVTFRYPEQEGVFADPAKVVTATESIQQHQRSSHKTAHPVFRVVTGTMGVVGIAGSIGGYYFYDKNKKRENQTTDASNALVSSWNHQAPSEAQLVEYRAVHEKITPYEDRKNLFLVGSATAGALALLSACGFIWTFYF